MRYRGVVALSCCCPFYSTNIDPMVHSMMLPRAMSRGVGITMVRLYGVISYCCGLCLLDCFVPEGADIWDT